MSEIQQYVTAFRRRAKEAQQLTQRRAVEAHEVASRCAEKLVEDFGAEKVFLFGSLAEDRFRANSDIDLVVSGLAPKLYFKASAQISRLAGEFKVDLIPFETYKYKAELFEKGEVLYESRRSTSVAASNRGSEKRARKTA